MRLVQQDELISHEVEGWGGPIPHQNVEGGTAGCGRRLPTRQPSASTQIKTLGAGATGHLPAETVSAGLFRSNALDQARRHE